MRKQQNPLEPTQSLTFQKRGRWKVDGASLGGARTFENYDECQISVLRVEIFVEIRGCGRCRRQHHGVCGSVPADIVKRLKFGRDLRRGNGDDSSVESHERRPKHERDHNNRELNSLGILRFAVCFHGHLCLLRFGEGSVLLSWLWLNPLRYICGLIMDQHVVHCAGAETQERGIMPRWSE